MSDSGDHGEPGVAIPFVLGTTEGSVGLTVYNTVGQVVRRMYLGVLPAGTHQVVWNGQNDAGQQMSSGVYLSPAARW